MPINNELASGQGLRRAQGLRHLGKGHGIDNYGQLHDDLGVKGQGYFGPVQAPDGSYSTEISAADDQGGYPLMVPTLTRPELGHLLSGAQPTESILGKAASWADYRRKQGLSPFAERQGLRYPIPE